jgi:[CysO sulfur-carrier protein]-S-L-cysteine hydrolase
MMGNSKLIVPITYYEELVNHGQSQLPYEACGLLAGRNQTVQSIWKLKNELNSDRRFFVGEKTVNQTLQSIAKRAEKVLAIYHSHPMTLPVPSYTDLLKPRFRGENGHCFIQDKKATCEVLSYSEGLI